MTRLTIRDWLAILIGNGLGISGVVWLFEYSGIESGFTMYLCILLCPYVPAFVTGLLAKRNERILSGITVLIVTLSMFVVIGCLSNQSYFWMHFMIWRRWGAFVAGICIIGMYSLGRQVGHLAVILKGKKAIEKDIYLDFDKKL